MKQQRDPEHYEVRVSRPDDFERYWSDLLAEVGGVPLEPSLEYDPMRSTDDAEVYDIRYTSLDRVRISGWYTRPREASVAPPYPGLLLVPGYISDPVIPKEWARQGYAALAVAPRGKVRSRSQVDARYPGLLVENSVDRSTYGYRAFFVDACRAVDLLIGRPEVDRSRVGVHGSSQGGALTVVLAALRRDAIACGAAGAPYLCGYLDAARLTRSYPYHEITEHLRRHPEQRAEIEETLPYFDVINFAPLIEAPMLVYIGLEDDVCPPETGFALHAAVQSEKRLIATPHCAHDAGAHWVDGEVRSFLAGHLQPTASSPSGADPEPGASAGFVSAAGAGVTMAQPEEVPSRPVEGFEPYWQRVDEDLARWPGRPSFEVSPARSSDQYTLYDVRLTSVGPYRLFGYLSVPQGEGPHPALYEVPRYGSVNHVPDHHDRLRYVVLTLMHRGQRLADSPFVAPYPGLLTLGIGDPSTYVYRAIVADCLRGAELLLGRPEVDPRRVAVIGDDLALLTAARRPGFAVVRYAGPMLYRALEARRLSDGYPIEELNDLLRAHPEREPDVARSLALLDPLHHAPAVTAETIVGVGEEGTAAGAGFLAPLLDRLGGKVTRYQQTFCGGTDHEQLDAMLAQRLGVPAMSRFLRVFE